MTGPIATLTPVHGMVRVIVTLTQNVMEALSAAETTVSTSTPLQSPVQTAVFLMVMVGHRTGIIVSPKPVCMARVIVTPTPSVLKALSVV